MAAPHRKQPPDTPMEEPLDHLTDVYRCLVSGSCPQHSAADVARAVFSGVCVHAGGVDVSCLSLSVLHRVVSGAEESRFCREVLGELRELDLLPRLVLHFRSEDQIVSHLAAKSVSACVFYHLQEFGTVSPAWQKNCVQAFQSSPPSAELDACLWSLTDLLTRLIRGARHDILGNLLSGFDCSLLALCSKFLPEGGHHDVTQSLLVFTPSSQQVNTFCLLLDLLEVLSASGVRVQSQRLVHTRSPALLAAVSRGSEYFVKKKAALLLKRAALQKLGEDLALGGASCSGLKHVNVSSDRHTLAHSVLTAVSQDWLQSVEVRSAAFFGGTKHIRDGETQEADSVMLRALSLIVLKSIELQIQTSGGAAVGGASEVSVYLERLWGFLRRCSVRLARLRHLCCWISLLFGEQDDDMMEAARALLAVFLYHREKTKNSARSAVLEAACSSGLNPHCHFVLLLQSISFDHSILLDFLISSETCFLEYLVRYLKCLRDDWPGFITACGGDSDSSRKLSLQESVPASHDGEKSSVASKAAASSRVDPPQRRLVDYDSSDESEPEDMEVSEAQPGPSACERRFSVDVSRLPASPRRKRFLSLTNSPSTTTAPHSGVVTSARAVLCLAQLREVVARLHAKKLFPYNPSSLLKLLTQQTHAARRCGNNGPDLLRLAALTPERIRWLA